MSSRNQNSITLSHLPRAQVLALRKRAKQLGVTLEDYVTSLITDALKFNESPARPTFRELSVPFQKAMSAMSDEEIDALSRPHRWKAKR